MKPVIKTMFLIGICLLIALPLEAQEDFTSEELEYLEFIQQAYTNTDELKTIQATFSQLAIQTATISGQEINTSTTQTGHLSAQKDKASASPLVYGLIDESLVILFPSQDVELDFTIETIFINGQTHLQFINLSDNDLADMLPHGWISPEEAFDAGFNMGNLSEGWQAFGLYPLNRDILRTIEELESQEIDGQLMRVFKVTLEQDAMLDASGMDASLNLSAYGRDGDKLLAAVLENAVYSQEIWIGIDDQLPYQMITATSLILEDMPMQGQSMDIEQTISVEIEYFGFNEPVEIQIPDDLPN